MGFNRPSKIQEKALPLLLADPPSNLIAQSQSGTGKTAAFVLAMLSRVDPAKKHPQVRAVSLSLSPSLHTPLFNTFTFNYQVICLSPTFDLAKQTGSVLEQMSKFAPEIRMAYALRGERGTWVVLVNCGLETRPLPLQRLVLSG